MDGMKCIRICYDNSSYIHERFICDWIGWRIIYPSVCLWVGGGGVRLLRKAVTSQYRSTLFTFGRFRLNNGESTLSEWSREDPVIFLWLKSLGMVIL
jgi:hypothetical protein